MLFRSREEKEERERERIRRLREEGKGERGRPTLRSRASSAVEMLGWGGPRETTQGA